MSNTLNNLTDVVELTAVPIFTAGEYPQGNFDTNFLQALADVYDPSFHEAPNYLAHEDETGRRPAGNLAFGWIKKLYLKGQTLFADLSSVPKLFAELILSGRIKKRSIELYTDLAGKGPYLRAIAWPMIPQVKALADVHPTQIFDDQNENILSIPFQEKESFMSQNEQTFVTKDELDLTLKQLRSDLLAEQQKIQSICDVKNFCEQMVLAGKMSPAERITEEPLLTAQVARESTMTFAENQSPLSEQRMNFYRERSPIINPNQPATTDPKREIRNPKLVNCFNEHQDFFARLGVSLDDLLHADKIQHNNINPLTS
ncbi:MAG: hypothetical protein WC975_07275 [Phycisphaerae bacterium]